MNIPVVENVLKHNDAFAELNRETLRSAGVKCVNLMGSPGCGKTALLERTLDRIKADVRVGVITGDLTTTRDAERLHAHCPHVSQINTGKGCHLDANQVRTGMANLPLGELDLLIIENVGNLICPVGFDLGQDVKVGMFSVPEGDDKPAKHPYVVLEAGLLLLNKVDLLPYVPFDIERFGRDIASIREHVPTMRISATTGEGVDAWTQWLRSLATTAHEPAAVDAR
jgi:hydrogenase nickel incorporation protein HypB